MRVIQAASAIALTLTIAGCAGTPPAGQQASTGRPAKCEHITGSFLCATPDDGSLSSNNSPTGSLPAGNISQGASAGGVR